MTNEGLMALVHIVILKALDMTFVLYDSEHSQSCSIIGISDKNVIIVYPITNLMTIERNRWSQLRSEAYTGALYSYICFSLHLRAYTL